MAITGITNPAAAASAYASTAKTLDVPGLDAAKGDRFEDFMVKAAQDAVQTMRVGEEASAKAVMGTASLTEVVEAVTAAELTLQTVVALRDKMLQAYQDIMRMPI
jgi:flagellar hook-basal body complex protein FliE